MADSTDEKQNCESPGPSSSGIGFDMGVREIKTAEESKDVTEACPAGVSMQLWKKFQELRERKNSITKTSFRKRVRGKRKAGDRDVATSAGESREDSSAKVQKSEPGKETDNKSKVTAQEAHWSDLKQYFGANDRFEPPACNRSPPKTILENRIDQAIESGDIDEAEQLSDTLAVRELGVKIAKAVDCRDFVKAKQEAETSQQARKKKQLAWGFEAKKRWEMKSNMGYM
ncbi:protein FAM204A isoform X1 [Callorhinchus milii]|uniref:Protein FAM204A n=2 Tax=Callorhinchus milii TaxID=7868 RepID=A0A4W3KF43_CALMI|nr:protein FAM204A isoform X1 [Callorhinchus milii]|eukprot:gi/632970694/ref/XP_007901793.1/ PREDICTED: protein FAM204A [Callorhinchus milii]